MHRLISLLACSALLVFAQPPKDRHVIVISLDGFPAYALDDSRLPVPTLRRLMREGTFARSMKTVNPSVTWPSHTSMVTGVRPEKHGVLYNGMLVRHGTSAPPKVEPWRDKSEMVHATTIYDLAYRAGLTTAQVDWVAIQNPGTITWEFAEIPKATGAIEREMIAAGLVTEPEIQEFGKANVTWRDQVWTQAAAHIIRRHKPNLLLFHVLNLDAAHHRYGPRSPASYSGIAFADDRVREILDALRGAGVLERSTVFIVSDHGFKTVRKNIRPMALLREHGLMGDVAVIPEGGTAMVYVLDPAKRAGLTPRLKQLFTGVEGIAGVLDAADFPRLGLPLPEKNDQMADLMLAAADGYAFSTSQSGSPVEALPPAATSGSHGYLNTDPEMNAVFIAWGNRIRAGVKLDAIENIDVAPTIAVLLSLEMKDIQGRKLSEILK